MKDRTFTVIFSILLIMGWVGFGVALFSFNPDQKVLWEFAVVYGSLSVALAGTFVCCIYRFRTFISKNKQVYVSKKEALRQGVLLVVCAEGLLLLQAFRVLSIWNGIALVAAIVVAELYFMSRR